MRIPLITTQGTIRGLALALLLAPVPGAAQQAPALQAPALQDDVEVGEITSMPLGAYGVAEVIGKPIFNIQGLALATIYDIVIGPDGRALYAILAVDPAAGAPEKLVAIDFDKLVVGRGSAGLVIEVPETELVRAPRFSYGTGAGS
ncbi:PRC-barrel domain-containing protein [Arenibaculum sp.]|uniref:PRC-barrel domain-containing protein n=1 Tax=Arenibaculum sp. TaxID=2865862 RepID=UPI002E0F626F|nr:PRC-barrel domain-containing protein [Arenibaculum sp.]